MNVPTLAGFTDAVHQSQATFRGLLEALSHPGRVVVLPDGLPRGPDPLARGIAAACLTLLDRNTWVWVQPGLGPAAQEWLQFHSGCRCLSEPGQAQFGLVTDPATLPRLSAFAHGSAEEPELSTTLLVQVANLGQGEGLELSGPGILTTERLQVELNNPALLEDLCCNASHYPLGVDIFLFCGDRVVGLPRATQMRRI